MPSRGELKKNLKALRAVLEARPMDLDARMRIARTHRLLGDAADAVAHYSAVARYLSLAGHPLQAIAVLRELLQVDPQHEETLLFLAKLYARTRAADASNRGRVARPILDGPATTSGPLDVADDGIPLTTTGIWRAIRPESTDALAVVKDVEDVGAVIDGDEDGDVVDADDLVVIDEVRAEDGGGRAAPAALSSFEESVLESVPLFSSLDAAAFLELGQAMVLHRASAGAVLFREGDRGDSCVVIAEGTATVTRDGESGPVEVTTLGAGDVTGLFALVAAETRQATVTALSDMQVFEIDRGAIERIMERHPGARAALAEILRERLTQSLLLDMPVCATLTGEALETFKDRLGERDLHDGDELFSPFADMDGVWIVLAGSLLVGKEDAEGNLDIAASLQPGDWVASTAATVGKPTGFAAEAAGPTSVLVVPHVVLHPLLAIHGVDGLGVSQVLGDTLRSGSFRR